MKLVMWVGHVYVLFDTPIGTMMRCLCSPNTTYMNTLVDYYKFLDDTFIDVDW